MQSNKLVAVFMTWKGRNLGEERRPTRRTPGGRAVLPAFEYAIHLTNVCGVRTILKGGLNA